MTNCWGHASSWESISGRTDLSRGVSSFLTDYQVELFVSFSKKFHQVAPIARMSQYQFPLLRRPSAVVPLWVACWREAFHKLSMPISGRPDRSSFWAIELQGSWLPQLLFPGLAEVAIRFIIGRDFAVTRSSPDSCWDRFSIVPEYTVELKWLMIVQAQKMIHSSRVKFPLVRMSASLFFGVDAVDLDFCVQINSIE